MIERTTTVYRLKKMFSILLAAGLLSAGTLLVSADVTEVTEVTDVNTVNTASGLTAAQTDTDGQGVAASEQPAPAEQQPGEGSASDEQPAPVDAQPGEGGAVSEQPAPADAQSGEGAASDEQPAPADAQSGEGAVSDEQPAPADAQSGEGAASDEQPAPADAQSGEGSASDEQPAPADAQSGEGNASDEQPALADAQSGEGSASDEQPAPVDAKQGGSGPSDDRAAASPTMPQAGVTGQAAMEKAAAGRASSSASAVPAPVKASAKSSAAVPAKTTGKISAGISAKKTAVPQLIPNGVYSFLSGLNPFKSLDISKGSNADKANVQAYDLNNSDAQHFRITFHPKDGTYSIMNVKSGKYLDVDRGRNVNGTNVQQYKGNNTLAQRWVVRKLPDGSFTFLSALGKSECALDLKGGASANGTNLQIYKANGTRAQQFFLQPYDPSLRMSVSDGIYVVESRARADGTAVLDISGGSMKDGANVQLYDKNGTAAQKFSLVRSGGAYRLMSCGSGRVVSVANGKAGKRANVQQDQSAWLASQKWVINDAGDGSVYIKLADQDYYLDAAGGKSANRTNIQVYTGNGTDAQKFRLRRESKGPVNDGVYFIKSASDPSKAVDIYDGSKKMKANAWLFDSNGSDAQKFRFQRGKDGLYTIVSINSGHALEVSEGSMKDGGNLQQYRTNDTLSQKWIPKLNKDGSLVLINARAGKVMDVQGGKLVPKANLEQYQYNGNPGQLFRLQKTTGTVTKDRDYSVQLPPAEEKYPQAAAVIRQIGRSLAAALNWSAGLPYVDSGMPISAGTRALADRGFTTRTGDCFVMAATFYEMAKVLEYNAHQVYGYVPLARGGMGEHSWVEIEQDGGTYVYDPDFQNETGANGYMLYYGQSGTWRYSSYHRIN